MSISGLSSWSHEGLPCLLISGYLCTISSLEGGVGRIKPRYGPTEGPKTDPGAVNFMLPCQMADRRSAVSSTNHQCGVWTYSALSPITTIL